MNSLNDPISRLLPERPFPSYTYVPGQTPHPTQQPNGHSYGVITQAVEPPDPDHWQTSITFLYGIDLFNYGYYWEAHETWEELWNACGRYGITADFLKGLIKLAAAGVKVREGVPNGVRTLSHGALMIFLKTAVTLGTKEIRYMGLSLKDLIRFTHELIRRPPMDSQSDIVPVKKVFEFRLQPVFYY